MAVTKVISFGGIGEECATFKIASGTTATVGMAVAFTGNGEVGKGTEGKPIAGVIKTVDGNGLVGVQYKGFCEDVAITETEAKQPSVGDVVAVDGAGALVKYTSTTDTTAGAAYADLEVTTPIQSLGAKVISVDTTALTATILL